MPLPPPLKHMHPHAFTCTHMRPSHAPAQVRWLLDHLKLYEFTGTQLRVLVGSTTYLTPTLPAPSPQQRQSAAGSDTAAVGAAAGSGGSVLSGHRQSIARYLAPVSAAAAAAPPSAQEDVRGALQALRGVVQAGLEGRRAALVGDRAYQDWHYKNKVGHVGRYARAACTLCTCSDAQYGACARQLPWGFGWV